MKGLLLPPLATLCLAVLAPLAVNATTQGALQDSSNAGSRTLASERALAVSLGASDRDAVVFRAEDRDGIVILAPTPDGGFQLRLFPGLGPQVDGVFVADIDGDGRNDLLVRRHDGTFDPWLTDGRGGVVPEPVLVAPAHPGAHHAPEPTRSELDAKKLQDESHAALQSRLTRGELASTLFDDRIRSAWLGTGPGAVVSAVAVNFEATASSGIVAVTADGQVVLSDSAGSARMVETWPLPAGFRPRLVAFGRFGVRGESAVAVVSEGSRPRLVVIHARPGGELVTRELFSPAATFNISVASGGLFFSPNSVNIQPGDTVHWTWAGIGHTVTSGTACVIDNLFCSPSNTSCATAPTSNTGATYDRTFPAAGTFPFFCRPHCGFGMTGTVIVAAPPASPGSVPDGAFVPGTPLKLGKGAGGTIDLSWTSSCTGTATNYAVYEGTLPITGTYDHAALNCALGNTNSANITPSPDNRYYLVVPANATNDGSYGVDLIGAVAHEIPAAAIACHPRLVSSCP